MVIDKNEIHIHSGVRKLHRRNRIYLEDPGLLFKVLILVRLSIRKVVNLNTMFIDLIQNLSKKKEMKCLPFIMLQTHRE